MSKRKVLQWILAMVGLLGFFGCLVMTVSAVAAQEWGRVVFYGFGAVVCIEVSVYNWMNRKDE